MFAANGLLVSANCLLNCNLMQALAGSGTLHLSKHALPPGVNAGCGGTIISKHTKGECLCR